MNRGAELLAFRLENDVALPDAILDAARRADLAFADVCGFGALEWVEIVKGEGVTRLVGPFDLLDLKGRIRRVGELDLAEFVVTLSRHTDAGLEVLGGRLARASARFVEVRFEPLSAFGAAVSVQTGAAQASPVATPPVAVAQEASPPPPPPRVERIALGEKWAEALAESKRLEKSGTAAARLWEDDEAAAVVPSRGDVVNHRQFGRCVVAKIDDDHVFLKKPDGRIVQLGLPILSFSIHGAEGDATVFDVQVRRG
jgi:predicted DNA-binding protein with PD1-like motif